jgi:hypothetical protein
MKYEHPLLKLLQSGLLIILWAHTALADSKSPILRVGDVVSVNVVDEEAISGDYKIAPDGTFQMPYLDDPVPAVGKTTKELTVTLLGMLKPDYILNPQVIIQLATKNNFTCTVLGQVSAPRAIPFDPDAGMTLQGALGRAGNTTISANPRGIEIIRNGKTIAAPMPESKDMKLLNGDSINVPKLLPTGSYQLMGHAKRGGNYEIPRGEKRSVLWAIINGGGVADTGRVKGTKLRRGAEKMEFKDESELEEVYILPGDIIEIGRRAF